MSARAAGRVGAVHVIAGLAAADGGPSYSVPRLCAALAARPDVAVTLLSVGAADSAPLESFQDGYSSRSFAWNLAHTPVFRDLRLSEGLERTLRAMRDWEVIHNHGLWLMPNVQAGWTARRAGRPLIIAPRGMLSPTALGFSRLRKSIFWRLLQGPVVRGAACIHATSDAEHQEVRAIGLVNPVAVIPNGIDLPDALDAPDAAPDGERTVLSLGRIHPKKGLEGLVRAWARVEAGRPEWRLRIIGPAEGGHDGQLKQLVAELGLGRVSIEGSLYGPGRLAAYRTSDVFVLPTLNENFGLTVSESLAAGTPVISTKGAPWSPLDSEGCGWWIDHGVEALAAALQTVTAMPRPALREMGAKGRAWMARDFSWDRVAQQMVEVYRWLSRGGEPPSVVRFN